MTMADRTYYRFLRGPQATVRDFTSRHARGLPIRPEIGETDADWRGISVQDDIEGARRLARRARFGSLCAVMRVPNNAPIRAEKTHGRGHWTLWGNPQAMLDTVVDVVNVLEGDP